METALLTEHLRFTPLTLLDDIINTVNEVVTRAVDAAESGLLATDPANLGFDKLYAQSNRIPDTDDRGAPVYPEARPEIEEGLHKLETLLESNVDRNFDKFEIYILRGVLNVPEELVPWVRLGHYEGIKLRTKSSQEKAVTAEEVQEMQQKLRQTKKLNRMLEANVRRNDAALKQLKALFEPASAEMKREQQSPGKHDATSTVENKGTYAFLTEGEAAKALGVSMSTAASAGQQNQDGPLTTNTSFALSQLPALRALLDELRPKLAELGDAEMAVAESNSARERRLYVNKQARKAVERQGVDVGVSVEGLGRRVQEDELVALESIADALPAKRNHVDVDGDEEMDA
ncbi:uncharacterized protein PV09_08653 [Verruconis gallopava]|uniref:MIND kinetochore complex component Mtw1 n=1 Tax=Verruconis gallopava TaxID=253628 RepID=A0A0D2AKZ5_9PEZI|nr:uncharacterized protein PV09_08653 [Verruconis gallopava]KIV99723.1 hypothetical protein PV09_08653 [Verruconis gallopava]